MQNLEMLNDHQKMMVDYYLNELYIYGKPTKMGWLNNGRTIRKSISMPFIDVSATDDGILYFTFIHLGNYKLKIDYYYFIELCEHTEDDAFIAKSIIATLLYEIVPLIEEIVPYRVKAKEILRIAKFSNPIDSGNCADAFSKLIKIEHTNNDKVNDILKELVAYIDNENVELISE